MRSALILAALALTLGTAAAQTAPGIPLKKNCKPTAGIVNDRGDRETRPRKLGDLPPATQYKALWNVVDGCSEPIVVRRGLGAPEPRRR